LIGGKRFYVIQLANGHVISDAFRSDLKAWEDAAQKLPDHEPCALSAPGWGGTKKGFPNEATQGCLDVLPEPGG
jgi:hypothetical protein